MKKTGLFCLIISLILVYNLAVLPVSADDTAVDTAVTQGCHTIDAAVPVLGITRLVDNAESVLVYECSSDTLMYAWNADAPIYPASLVKIMTALIAVQSVNMTDVVTVTEQVLNTVSENAVSAELQDNEVLSVQDLLYCMLVGSANDAAAVLANHISGSQDAFVAEMNRMAEELGCTGTVFSDPHGLSSEQQSTARDMGRILSAAMKNELFKEIFTAAEYTVKPTNKFKERKLETGNLLMDPDSALYYDERVTGGRTAAGSSGERSIAATAEKDGLEIVSIVIDAKSVYREDGYTITTIGGYNETKALLDSCFSGYRTEQIIYDGQALKQYRVSGGDSDLVVGPRISVSTILPEKVDQTTLTYRYNDRSNGLRAPVQKGQIVSYVEIWNGPICIASADLYAMNSVSILQETAVANENAEKQAGISVIMWILLGIIAAASAVVLAMRFISTVKMRARKRRSRVNRRNRRRIR